MTDIIALASGGFLAVGNYVGMQYGTATSWLSSDGLTWQRAPGYPALEQGEMLAVIEGPDSLVAVGSFGAPDNYIPTVWQGP
jgi:beta-lactam-binding protein with PASTA domain